MRGFQDFISFTKAHSELKRCMIRCDLNLPSDIEDLSRVYAIKDTVLSVLSLGLKVVLISHYKRPTIEDVANPKFSLAKIAPKVSEVLGKEVFFEKRSIFDMEPDEVNHDLTLFENLRFYEGETKNEAELSERLSKFADVYLNDAFSVSHRAHASVEGITHFLPSFAGKALEAEIIGISKACQDIERPFVALIGGSKVSSKIDVLKQISQTADVLVVAGAMSNTFLAAQGHDMRQSLVEPELFDTARDILANSKAKILLPVDFVTSMDINTPGTVNSLNEIPDGQACFDIGPESTKAIIDVLNGAKTLLWNGATGAFEFANFDQSSKILSKEIARLTKENSLISVVGGGETIASIGEYKPEMTFVSTAGGAFLEYISGKKFPTLKALGM